MTNDAIKQALELLKSDRNEHMEIVQILNKTIDYYEDKLKSNHALPLYPNSLDTVSKPIIEDKLNTIQDKNTNGTFPKGASYKEKLLIVLEHHLKQATKFPVLEEAFKNKTGIKRYLRGDIYELRTEGKVVSIRYNSSNNHVFWGMPEWTEETDLGFMFKGEYAPDPVNFPKGIWKGENMVEIDVFNKDKKKTHHDDNAPKNIAVSSSNNEGEKATTVYS